MLYPERLINTFEFEGFPGQAGLVTTLFEELPDGNTKFIETTVYPSLEARDGILESGMSEGRLNFWIGLSNCLKRSMLDNCVKRQCVIVSHTAVDRTSVLTVSRNIEWGRDRTLYWRIAVLGPGVSADMRGACLARSHPWRTCE